MTNYKTINGLARALANCVVQDIAYSNKRYIWSLKDFTQADKTLALELTKRIANMIKGGCTLDYIVSYLHNAGMEHVGFQLQDQILKFVRT